jgi:hypothetical protein
LGYSLGTTGTPTASPELDAGEAQGRSRPLAQ